MKNLLHTLCHPQVRSIPDPHEAEKIFERNKKHLYILSITIFLIIAKILLSDASTYCQSVRITSSLLVLLSFLTFCRTHVWIYYLTHTLYFCVYPFYICLYHHELSLCMMGLAFAGPPALLLLTENRRYYLFSAFSQLLVLNTFFKTALKAHLEISNTHAFIEGLIGATTLQMIAALFTNVLIQSELITAREKFCQARDKAESVIRSYKTFMQSFSQEIKSPLHGITGNLEAALLHSPSSQTEIPLRSAQVCSEMLLLFIDNVLDMGKVGVNDLKLTLKPVQVGDVINKIWKRYSEFIRNKELNGMLKIQNEVPKTLILDASRLNQIISNIMSNAIKFTDKGTVHLTVRWVDTSKLNESCFEPKPYEDKDEGLFEKEESLSLLTYGAEEETRGSYTQLSHLQSKIDLDALRQANSKRGVLKIIVRDTGSGIHEGVLSRIFTKFAGFSSEKEKNSAHHHPKIGLWVTKEICKSMKGDVRVYSKMGIGTTCVVCIPCESVMNETSQG